MEEALSGKKADAPDLEKLPIIHGTEAFNDIIAVKARLHHTTKRSPEQFAYILKKFTKATKDHPNAPQFSDDIAGDGNKMHITHALLMAMMSSKLGITVDEFGPLFAIDHDISGYPKFAKTILCEIMPTAEKITKVIQNAKTIEEIKYLVPAGGQLYIDRTNTRIRRSLDDTGEYYGRKIQFTINSTVIGSNAGMVVMAKRPVRESMHNPAMLCNADVDLGPLVNGGASEKDRVTIYMGDGYTGIEDMPGADIRRPAIKSKNSRLGRIRGRASGARVNTRQVIELLEQYNVMTRPYAGSDEDYYTDLLVATGLSNFDLLWDGKRLRHGF